MQCVKVLEACISSTSLVNVDFHDVNFSEVNDDLLVRAISGLQTVVLSRTTNPLWNWPAFQSAGGLHLFNYIGQCEAQLCQPEQSEWWAASQGHFRFTDCQPGLHQTYNWPVCQSTGGLHLFLYIGQNKLKKSQPYQSEWWAICQGCLLPTYSKLVLVSVDFWRLTNV